MAGLLTLTEMQAAAFPCNPVSDYWNVPSEVLQNQNCVNILVLDMFNSAWSVFEDVIIWLMPIPVVWRLKVDFSRKGQSQQSRPREKVAMLTLDVISQLVSIPSSQSRSFPSLLPSSASTPWLSGSAPRISHGISLLFPSSAISNVALLSSPPLFLPFILYSVAQRCKRRRSGGAR